MKILQVIPTFGMGGAETMCQGLCLQLHRMGHQVTAVSLSGDHTPLTDGLEAAGVPVRYLDKALGSGAACVGKLKALIRQEQPQVIHTHLHALKYVALAGARAPIVHTVHNQADKEAVFLDRQIGKFLFRHKKALPVALTREIRQSVATLYGLQEGNIPLVTNGIDLGRCIPKNDYALHYPIRLLHVGRFYPQKNHAALIEACGILKKRGLNCELHCYGDGPLLSEMEEKVKAMGLEEQVILKGVTQDVYTVMSRADLFLLPSSWEGMPMTIIEAMGSGLPVIASQVGGIPDMIVPEKSGILIEPQARALADAVERLVKDEALRQALGAGGKESSRNFSLDAMAQGYLDLYKTAVPGGCL